MYDLYVIPRAKADLADLDATTRAKVQKKFRRIAANPLVGKPLHRPLAGCRSEHVSPNLRVVYCVNDSDQSVTVLAVGPRQAGKTSDVYDEALRRR